MHRHALYRSHVVRRLVQHSELAHHRVGGFVTALLLPACWAPALVVPEPDVFSHIYRLVLDLRN